MLEKSQGEKGHALFLVMASVIFVILLGWFGYKWIDLKVKTVINSQPPIEFITKTIENGQITTAISQTLTPAATLVENAEILAESVVETAIELVRSGLDNELAGMGFSPEEMATMLKAIKGDHVVSEYSSKTVNQDAVNPAVQETLSK